MKTVNINAMHAMVADSTPRSEHRPEDTSATRSSTDGRQETMNDRVRPDLGVAIVVLCSLIVLIGMPLLWWSGMTLLQAVLLTIFVQIAVFLVIMIIGLSLFSRDDECGLSSERPNGTAIPNLKIWRSYSRDGADADAPRVALIAEDSVQTRQIATDLAQQGYDIHHTTDVDAMFETVQTHPDDWEFMIFDIDVIDDLESTVDDLMNFREDCASIPILLLSGSITRDEFSGYRRAIGDATLRKPVFRSRLRDGIAAMKANWQARDLVCGTVAGND